MYSVSAARSRSGSGVPVPSAAREKGMPRPIPLVGCEVYITRSPAGDQIGVRSMLGAERELLGNLANPVEDPDIVAFVATVERDQFTIGGKTWRHERPGRCARHRLFTSHAIDEDHRACLVRGFHCRNEDQRAVPADVEFGGASRQCRDTVHRHARLTGRFKAREVEADRIQAASSRVDQVTALQRTAPGCRRSESASWPACAGRASRSARGRHPLAPEPW